MSEEQLELEIAPVGEDIVIESTNEVEIVKTETTIRKKKPVLKHCSIPTCLRRSDEVDINGEKYMFHEYPSDVTLRHKWQTMLNAPDALEGEFRLVGQKTLICSSHFQPSCYKEVPSGKRLKRGAVPTIDVPFLMCKSSIDLYKRHGKLKAVNKKLRKFGTSIRHTVNVEEKTEPEVPTTTEKSKSVCVPSDTFQPSPNINKDIKKDKGFIIMHNPEIGKNSKDSVSVGVTCKLLDKSDYLSMKRKKNKLRMQNVRLRQKLSKLEEENMTLRVKWDTWSKKSAEIDKIEKDAKDEIPSACFIKDLISNYDKKRPTWSETTIRYSIVWRMSGPIGYERACTSKLVKLPKKSTINKHLSARDDKAINDGAIVLLKVKANKIKTDKDRITHLHLEYLDIGKRNIYNVGPETFEATKLLCATLKSTNLEFSIALSYKFLQKIDIDEREKFIWEAIATIDEIGFSVCSLHIDGNTFNIERSSLTEHIVYQDNSSDDNNIECVTQGEDELVLVQYKDTTSLPVKEEILHFKGNKRKSKDSSIIVTEESDNKRQRKQLNIPSSDACNMPTSDEQIIIITPCDEISSVSQDSAIVTFINNSGEPIEMSKKPSKTEKWNLDTLLKKIKINIVRWEEMEMEFDLIGVEAGFANAIRRILLSEVPSMAFDKVNMMNNSSVLQDEVLAHRLGLIPIKADPRQFEYRPQGAAPSEQDTLIFELKVKCYKDGKFDVKDKENYTRVKEQVYSQHLQWIPKGSQQQLFSEEQVKPVEDDILINRLRPGQEIELTLEAIKGIGRDHAKFSPVATAFYRLLPSIELVKQIEGDDAFTLQKCFSPGVIEIVEKNGKQIAKVADARYDSCSRNVLLHPELKDAVIMERVEDHFIFTVESVGALTPDILVEESLKVLKKKCLNIMDELQKSLQTVK